MTRPRCKRHGNPLICLKCRASKGGKVKSARKTAANRLKAKSGSDARWKVPSAAAMLARKEGISRQLAYYRLKREREERIRARDESKTD